jgi:hypothetical protein
MTPVKIEISSAMKMPEPASIRMATMSGANAVGAIYGSVEAHDPSRTKNSAPPSE